MREERQKRKVGIRSRNWVWDPWGQISIQGFFPSDHLQKYKYFVPLNSSGGKGQLSFPVFLMEKQLVFPLGWQHWMGNDWWIPSVVPALLFHGNPSPWHKARNWAGAKGGHQTKHSPEILFKALALCHTWLPHETSLKHYTLLSKKLQHGMAGEESSCRLLGKGKNTWTRI